ncbi:glycosyltransferase family 2 protein [Candidatus Sulfuricurvum sp. RIFRC-1]|uniref:glycosyltransferase family 2 protein n=1 Tax=Candidatus Sulfuricurvum sp. RIFRC-1 TaxID=1249480 RepID=UPI0003217AA0|nr:glycosyltransferase family 2 protein [Candidatus Sulfuricurvum sp. RIFRC-1]
MDNIHISIVTPVYGCCGSLNDLYLRLEKTLSSITNDFEIIMINDASPDNAWKGIKELASKDSRVKGIDLSRNFGQHYAITAGLDYAKGDWVVVMDCDLQDQPEEIIKLYNKAQEGYDIVFASRVERQDNYFKRLGSKFFYNLLSYLTDTQQDASVANFGVYSRQSIDAILSMKDQIKYFPVMTKWVGFNTVTIPIKHAKRTFGTSSYSLRKLLSLSIDIMLSFSDKPLKITVKTGFFISSISFMIACIVLMKSLLTGYQVPGWASMMMSLWFLGGLIIMVLGIIGIYIGKTFDQTKNRPVYIIKDVI